MRRAFTIIELLVSIGIFVVVSTLMFGALFGATEIFRRGEAARQAGDEATAVIAALQEDLSRAVPIRLRDGKPAPEWGRVYADCDVTGNCRLSLVVENPDRAQVRWIPSPIAPDRKLVGMRKWVVWYTQPGTVPMPTAADTVLRRDEWDMTENGAIVDTNGLSIGSLPTATTPNPLRRDVITNGCLHFGTWVEVVQAHRDVTSGPAGPVIGWEDAQIPPYVPIPSDDGHFDSSELIAPRTPGPDFYPQPDAIRVSLVLTGGGRFATRGTLIGALTAGAPTSARISGIKALPTISGSLLRIGDEWLRYDDFRGGRIDGLKRGQLRSSAAAHPDRSLVLVGQPFSLVVALPR